MYWANSCLYTSGLRFIKKALPKYLDSGWNFSQLRVKTICSCFEWNLGFFVISTDGIYYQVRFLHRGNSYEDIETFKLLDLELV